MRVTVREKKLIDGSSSIYLDIYHKGKRRYEFLNLYYTKNRVQNRETKLLVEKIRTKREIELQYNSYGFIPETKMQSNFVSYLDIMANEKTKNSPFICAVKMVKKFSGDILTFQQVDEKWLEDFKRYLLKKVSQNSSAIYFQKVKQGLKRAKLEKIIIRDPGEYVKNIPLIETERVFLEFTELETLVNTKCKNDNVKRAFLFSCFTGLRFGDVKKLTWKEIKGKKLHFIQEKTKSVTYLPLNEMALNLLKQKSNIISIDKQLIFELPRIWWTNEILKEWAKKAKIKKNLSYHAARHTFATMSLTYGNDIYVTSALLAHKNVKTTQIYARIIDQKINEAIDRLPTIAL